MCLAVPGRITAVHEGDPGDLDAQLRAADVDMLGARREVSLRLVPEAREGDYVLVHAGFGIQVIDEREAAETIRLLQEMDELLDDELPAPEGAA